MKFPHLQQSTAVLILSATLSALPSLAQSTNAKPAGAAPEAPPATGKVVEDIVARVNDQIITQSDYDRPRNNSITSPSSKPYLPASYSRNKPICCAT